MLNWLDGRELPHPPAGEDAPARKRKVVVFDEELSLATVAHPDAPVKLVVEA